jgi:hypothetical protein
MSERGTTGGGASLSQVQGILRLTVWVGVLVLCVALIGLPLAAGSAAGALEPEE